MVSALRDPVGNSSAAGSVADASGEKSDVLRQLEDVHGSLADLTWLEPELRPFMGLPTRSFSGRSVPYWDAQDVLDLCDQIRQSSLIGPEADAVLRPAEQLASMLLAEWRWLDMLTEEQKEQQRALRDVSDEVATERRRRESEDQWGDAWHTFLETLRVHGGKAIELLAASLFIGAVIETCRWLVTGVIASVCGGLRTMLLDVAAALAVKWANGVRAAADTTRWVVDRVRHQLIDAREKLALYISSQSALLALIEKARRVLLSIGVPPQYLGLEPGFVRDLTEAEAEQIVGGGPGADQSFSDGGVPEYPTVPMQENFVGEQGRDGVLYLDEAARQQFAVTSREGLLYDSKGDLLDTTSAVVAMPDSEGYALTVMDAEGRLYVSPFEVKNHFHHSTLSSGQPVIWAGYAHVEGGRIISLWNWSGHYFTPSAQNDVLVDALGRLYGIEVQPHQVRNYSPK